MPTHCMELMGLAKKITEAKMVKNFRVVVMMEHVRGPKYTTVMKIKLWERERRVRLLSSAMRDTTGTRAGCTTLFS